MSLTFASITPHPPIIVPGIGKPEDLKKAKDTIEAMEKLSNKIAEEKPDMIIIISPHALTHHDRFAVYGSPKFYGDFENFNETKISMRFDNNLELADEIVKKSNDAGINAFLFGDPDNDYFELDHGEMVPLYYLTKNLPEEVQIIPIAYSYLDRAQHYGFGQIIKDVCNSPTFKNKKIALIASGDLSHRLIHSASADYSESGRSFDNQIVEFIKYNKVREIVEMDEQLIEEAGECGYRSILILLGALDNVKYTPEILSYQGPFGVGYLVANFEIELD
jgi:aromatic ring-opening dioxygenase LigB subunit